jgi:hypothetical protein
VDTKAGFYAEGVFLLRYLNFQRIGLANYILGLMATIVLNR